jgi:rare lipoprotein A
MFRPITVNETIFYYFKAYIAQTTACNRCRDIGVAVANSPARATIGRLFPRYPNPLEDPMKRWQIILVSSLLAWITCSATLATAGTEEGLASYYADSLHGNKTASGEPYDKDALTAAHRTLEFGTEAKVTYLKTGKTVTVRINDRGPHVKDRIIDLSGAAAAKIGLKDAGVGEVRVETAN